MTTFEDLDDTQTVTVRSADFQLSNVLVDGSALDTTVDKGANPIPVDFTVSNDGDATAAADISLNISQNGEAVITRERTTPFQLSPGDSYGSAFTNVDVGGLAPGDYAVSVTTDDAEVNGTLTVSGSNYQVDSLDIAGEGNDTTVVEDDAPFEISANVENLGNLADDQDVTLNITTRSGSTIRSSSL